MCVADPCYYIVQWIKIVQVIKEVIMLSRCMCVCVMVMRAGDKYVLRHDHPIE